MLCPEKVSSCMAMTLSLLSVKQAHLLPGKAHNSRLSPFDSMEAEQKEEKERCAIFP